MPNLPATTFRREVAAVLRSQGWDVDSDRDFRHPRTGAAFSFTTDDETLTVYVSRELPWPSTVEVLHLDRLTTTTGRFVRIITAATDPTD